MADRTLRDLIVGPDAPPAPVASAPAAPTDQGSSLATPDDAGAAFMAHRQDMGDAALLAAAQARRASTQTASTSSSEMILGVHPLPTGTEPPLAPPGSQEMYDKAGNRIIYNYDESGGFHILSVVKGAGTVAGAVTKDVISGLAHAPMQVIGGVTDAARNAFTAADHLGDWLNDHVADLRLPSTGSALLDNPAEAIAGAIPKVPPATSVTGGLIRDTAEFLTGFLPAMRAAKAIGLTEAAGKAGATVAAGSATSAVVMDPLQENLANLVQKYPLLSNPVTEFLAANPDDNEAVARLKKAVEGAGMGALTEGFIFAIRALRAAHIAKAKPGAVRDNLQMARALHGEVRPEELNISGLPEDAPLVSVQPAGFQESPAVTSAAGKIDEALTATETGVPSHVAAEGVAGSADDTAGQAGKPALGEPKVMINFDRINTPDDVRQVIADTVSAYAPGIDEARRGVRSNEATQQAADALGMSVDDVLSRRRGQPMNAEEAVAARGLWAASAEKLLELAKAAAAPNAGAVDQFKFRRMLAIHYAVQAEVIGARTETARALQSWAMPVGGGSVERARALEQILTNSGGGAEVTAALAKRIADLARSGADPATMNAALRKGAFAKTMDAVREIWINGLLSSPTTHVVNTTSNMVVAMQQIYERLAAEKVASLLGRSAPEGGVAPGEAAAMTYGLVSGLKDAFRLSWQAIKTGVTGQTLNKIESIEPAVSAEAFGLGKSTALGHTVDFLGATFRVPGRLLAAEDEFFKSVGYRMELQAQAWRTASGEGLAGAERDARVADIVANPPENIRLSAADQALYATFNDVPGKWAQAILNIRRDIPPLGYILPFVRTPANILRYSLERTMFAPAVRQWRADIAAGGARADLAMARMATGSSIMLLAFDYADAGYVSGAGPTDPGEREALRRQGWQPYSVFVNGKWYSYNRADPFGMTMGFAADFSEYMRQSDPPDADVDKWSEALAGGIAMVSQATVNKTYLQGLAQFVQMMSDPKRYSDQYVTGVIGSFVPFVSGLRFAKNAMDPTIRDNNGLLESIEAGLPGLSKNLTPRRDLWGAPLRPDAAYGRAYDLLSPIKVTQTRNSPIDAEMVRLGYTPQRIAKRTDMAGAKIDLGNFPQAYDDYVRLAGNEMRLPQYENLGAKDFLDRVVSGQSPTWSAVYRLGSDGPDGGKVAFIRTTIQDYRTASAGAVLRDPRNQKLLMLWQSRKAAAQEQRLPAGMQGTTFPPSMFMPNAQ